MTPLAFLCPVAFLLVGLAAAGLLGYLAYRKGQTPRRTEKVFRCRVARMRDGICKVKGRLVARGEVLTSPMTDKKCLYYRFKVDQAYLVRTWATSFGLLGEGDESMKSQESYRPLVKDEQCVAVALEDETGIAHLDLRDVEDKALVKRAAAELNTSLDNNLWFELMLQKRYGRSTLLDRRQTGMGALPSPEAFLDPDPSSLDIQPWVKEGREQPKARASEEIIEEGIEVTVVGEVETRDGRPPRFRPVDHPLIVTTRPREARLPPPADPAKGLWIAAVAVLGGTLLLTLVGILIVAANVRWSRGF